MESKCNLCDEQLVMNVNTCRFCWLNRPFGKRTHCRLHCTWYDNPAITSVGCRHPECVEPTAHTSMDHPCEWCHQPGHAAPHCPIKRLGGSQVTATDQCVVCAESLVGSACGYCDSMRAEHVDHCGLHCRNYLNHHVAEGECRHGGCPDPSKHSSSKHICGKCRMRGHADSVCPSGR